MTITEEIRKACPDPAKRKLNQPKTPKEEIASPVNLYLLEGSCSKCSQFLQRKNAIIVSYFYTVNMSYIPCTACPTRGSVQDPIKILLDSVAPYTLVSSLHSNCSPP